MLFILAVAIFINCVHVNVVCAHYGAYFTEPKEVSTPGDPSIVKYFDTQYADCKQSQIHLQQHFCDVNRAVFKARIIKQVNVYECEIDIIKVYRGDTELSNQKRLFNNKYCPAALKIGEVYLITGEFSNGDQGIYTSRGHWVEQFNKVSVIQKFGLRGYFKRECGKYGGYLCQVKSCSGADCSVIDKFACKIDESWDQSVKECYMRKSVCRKPWKRCVWRSWDMSKDDNGRNFRRIKCN